MTMRQKIFSALATCQIITTWASPGLVDKNTPKPFGIVVFEDEMQSVENSAGHFQTFTVWPYMEKGSFVDLDEAVEEIRAKLSGYEYEGTGKDFTDDDLEAITKVMQFRIPFARRR